MADSEQKSIAERVAALEERFAKLDETRRSVIPDKVWNSAAFQAYRERNARISLEIMLRQMKDAEDKIEEARLYAAEKCAVEDEQKGIDDREARRAKAMFESVTEKHLRNGVPPEEARLLAALECYENFRSVPPGYQVEQKPEGGFIIRPGYVV